MEATGDDKEEEISPGSSSEDYRKVEDCQPNSVQKDQEQFESNQKIEEACIDAEEMHSETLEGPQSKKHKTSESKIPSIRDSEHSPEFPANFKVRQAIGDGDCFFDSLAKGLRVLKPHMNISVRSLRKVCKHFAQRQLEKDQSWLKEALEKEAEPLSVYIPCIEFTIQDIAQNSGTVSVLGLSAPICGRSEIEGRIICEVYNVKLHIIEERVVDGKVEMLNQIIDRNGSKRVDDVDNLEGNIISITNKSTGHFQPILGVQGTHHTKQHSPESSDNNDKLKSKKELNSTVMSHDTKKKKLTRFNISFSRKNKNIALDIQKQPTNKQGWEESDTNSGGENLAIDHHKYDRSRQRICLPYSHDLPLDKDLKLSNRKFEFIIESDLKHLQNLHLKTSKKHSFCNRPAHPDEILLVHFASKIYEEEIDGKEFSNKIQPSGWKILTTAHNQHFQNDYFGAAYWNPQHQHVVIAHRGTKSKSSGGLWTDIRGILHNTYVPQMSSAVTFAYKITNVLNKLNKKLKVNIHLSITGHSLGGWLAQITTLTTKYFILETFAEHPSFVKGEQLGYHAHTVVFDSPGCKDMLSKLVTDFDLRHYKDNNSLSPSSLDITSYLSAPNLVNTCRSHLGTLYRVFIEDLPPERSSWDFATYTKETHSIIKIKTALDPQNSKAMKEVIDWPLVKKGITMRALEKLLKISHDILKVLQKTVFNKDEYTHLPNCSEYEYFHKLAKEVTDYNPEPDDKEGYCIVRYQVKDIDKTKCNISVFTQPELQFLRSYQNSRKLLFPSQLESLFSFLEDGATEITEVLRRFEIEENKKIVSTSSEEEKHRLISYVKSILHFYPTINSKISDQQRRVQVWFDIREPVHSFSGRQEQLDQITTFIKKGMVIISGLAGIGKSELAIKYAHDHRKDHDNNVIWINAETHDTAKDSFRRLLKQLRIPTVDQDKDEKTVELMAKDVFDYFVGQRCLYIFDNAENYSVMKEFLPSKSKECHVLITSQNRELFNKQEYGNVETINLDILPKDKAKEFVKNALDINDIMQNKEIEELIEILGCLPLALQHAVAYMKKMGYNNTIGTYVKVYKKSEPEIQYFLNQNNLDTYNKTIFLTFETSINRIKQEETGKLALEILNVIAYFAPDNIPAETFLMLSLHHFKKHDDGTQMFRARGVLMEAICLLNKFSLINLKDKGKEKLVSIHRLVQDVIRLGLKKNNEESVILEEQVLAKALELLKEYLVKQENAQNYMPHIISVWNYACKYKRLIEDYIVNNDNGREAYTTYLHTIIGSSSYEVVEAVLDKIDCGKVKEIINTKDKERRTSLYNAALNGNEQILQILIEKGAQVNVKKKHEWTTLHAAAKNGHLESVNVLLKNNANVNNKTGFKFTPLHLAARDGHFEVISVLLNAGADINAETRYRYTPLHVAAENNQLKVVQALLKAEVNINARTEYKFTPLHLASKKGNLEIVKCLLDMDSDVNALDNGHFSPLHLAVLNSHLEVVNTLLGKGADINAQTTNGNTALHLAVENDNEKIVEFLINKNVNIDVENKEGKTALNLAQERNNLQIRNYIIQRSFSRNPEVTDITG